MLKIIGWIFILIIGFAAYNEPLYWGILSVWILLQVYLGHRKKQRKEEKNLYYFKPSVSADYAVQPSRTRTEQRSVPARKIIRIPNARDFLFDFLGHGKKADVIFLDVETNGLSGRDSVLSISAIKCTLDMKTFTLSEKERFERYYFPKEKYNPKAIEVNGLNQSEIELRRGSASYPEHFKDDKDFQLFTEGVKHFVAHNADFDSKFVPPMKEGKTFCTMKTNKNIMCLPGLKYPKLEEAAGHYKIAFSRDLAHGSTYDTEVCMAVFRCMLSEVKSSIADELLCPYCNKPLDVFPMRAKACPECGKKIYVRQRPETRRKALLREDQLEELREEWATT